jgi:diguanylate cyclase (GGDEF)-like protein/PAS domain S-box-containing protein
MIRFRLKTFRGYTLVLEVSALLVTLAILSGVAWFTVNRMNDKYLYPARDDAAKVHLSLSNHLDAVRPKLEGFAALSEADRSPATVDLLTEFSDIYRLDRDLRVNRIYKAVPGSRVSLGYSFSGGRLADLQEGSGNWNCYSEIMRGREDGAPSVYFLVNRNGSHFLARLNLAYIHNFFARYAQFSGHPLLLVSKDGVVILSSDSRLAIPSVELKRWRDAGSDTSQFSAGDRRWIPLVATMDTLGAKIVILIPTEMLDSQRGILLAFLCAFMVGLIVLVFVKNLQVNRLLLQPLADFATSLSDLEQGRPLPNKGITHRFDELSNIYTRFQSMAEAIKLREKSLLDSEARFKVVVDSSPLAIYISKARGEKAVYVNPTFIKLFGYTIEEVSTPEHLYKLIYPDESYRQHLLEEWLRRMRRAIETQASIEPMEALATCKDGSQKCIQWGFENLGELNWLYGLDLTERNKAEQLLKDANGKLEALSITDGLTGLANRRRFDEKLAEEIPRHARKETTLSLILMDIDHFKAFNDHYGHVAGDECLRQVAKVIGESAARAADVAARYGGEEFACILPETSIDNALIVADHIRQGIQRLAIKHEASDSGEFVSLSMGVVSIRCNNTDNPDEIIHQADELLYRAKANGRDRIEYDSCQPTEGESLALSESFSG